MTDIWKKVLDSQYAAAMRTMELVIENCPDDLWDSREQGPPVWHVLYHAAFYAQLYVGDSEDSLRPQSLHWPNAEQLGEEPTNLISKEQLSDYFIWLRRFLKGQIEGCTEGDLKGDAPFHWLPFSRAECLVYSLRHVQHHAAEMCDRVKAATGKGFSWVGKGEL